MDAPRALESTQDRGDEGPADAEQITIQKPPRLVVPTHSVVAESDPSRPLHRRGRMAASHALVPEINGQRISVRRDMPSSKPESECESYLFVARNGVDGASPGTVFYQAADAELAESLCRLCQREYGDQLRFTHKPSSSFSPDEQVLMDEALDDLSIYDDPDPGIYDPPPTREMLMRAQYALRAQRWEEMLKQRRERANTPARPASRPQAACGAQSAGCRLADDVLLRICRIAADDPELTAQHVDDLRKACSLIGSRYLGTGAQLELALSLLASVLGSHSRFNPTHLPMGYSGPTIKSNGWLDRDALERAAKQIVGLMWADCSPDRVAFRVEHAISEAIRLGFMEEKQYDAWRPGMPSGSGWRVALAATAYGVMKAGAAGTSSSSDGCAVLGPPAPAAPVSDAAETAEAPSPSAQPTDMPSSTSDGPEGKPELPPEVAEFVVQVQRLTSAEQAYVLRFHLFMYAQAYHNLVEAVATSPVGWVDMELNAWYLQIVKAIRNLLALPEFAEFPDGFEPVAPNLFPCSDLEVGWEDCVGPPVMDFLGRAQAFMLDSGPVSPENEEFVKGILEVCRGKCVEAFEIAARFRQRAEATFKKMLDRVGHRANEGRAAARVAPGATDGAGDAPSGDKPPQGAPPGLTTQRPSTPSASIPGPSPVAGDSRSGEDPSVDTCVSREDEAADTRQYRTRLFALRERRGLADDDFAAEGGANVRQTAARLADELDVWVEAIRDADADRNPAGGYWSVLGDDLRDMLGPAELASGVFEDDWTPLLTHLRMNGQAELAKTLDRLAEAVIPQAQELARDLDAVAYLRNGGPRDALYEHYAREDLATHEACVAQGRQDVGRDVMRIVAMLRTLAENETNSATTATIVSKSKPRRAPQRGTRAANIEKLEKELEKHLLAARDHAHSLRDRDREPALLPRPTQKELARRTGLTQPDVSRCLRDQRAKVLKILWETAESLDEVMKYKRR